MVAADGRMLRPTECTRGGADPLEIARAAPAR
jgi:hypothetical protein